MAGNFTIYISPAQFWSIPWAVNMHRLARTHPSFLQIPNYNSNGCAICGTLTNYVGQMLTICKPLNACIHSLAFLMG